MTQSDRSTSPPALTINQTIQAIIELEHGALEASQVPRVLRSARVHLVETLKAARRGE